MPNSAKYIVDHNTEAPIIPFRGFMLGNPWTDPMANALGRVETMYGHGLVAKPLYDRARAACDGAHDDVLGCVAAAGAAIGLSGDAGRSLRRDRTA